MRRCSRWTQPATVRRGTRSGWYEVGMTAILGAEVPARAPLANDGRAMGHYGAVEIAGVAYPRVGADEGAA